MVAMYNKLQMIEKTKFKGIYLDTYANQPSLMRLSHYKAYCIEFHVSMDIFKEEDEK